MGWVLLIVLLGGPTSDCCCKPAKVVINVVRVVGEMWGHLRFVNKN